MESHINSPNDDEESRLKKRLDKLAEDIKKLPLDRISKLEKLVKSMDKKVVGLREAAEILDVSVDTIRRSIKAGSIKAFQINKSGNWKITIEEIERFLRGNR